MLTVGSRQRRLEWLGSCSSHNVSLDKECSVLTALFAGWRNASLSNTYTLNVAREEISAPPY